MIRKRRKAAVAAVVAMLVCSALAYLWFEGRAAERIRDRIQSLPGVSYCLMTHSDTLLTGKNLSLIVLLDRSATEAQVVEVGRTFTKLRRGLLFRGHKGGLSLNYPARGTLPRNPLTDDHSSAHFSFGPSDGEPPPNADQVTKLLAVWMRTSASPIVEMVDITATRASVTLTPEATEASAIALQRSDPVLAAASWEIKLVYNDYGDTRNYVSTPTPPSDADRALWSQISAAVGKYYRATAITRPAGAWDQADTEVEINIDTSAESEEATRRITPAVTALLPRFGHPAALVVWGHDGPIRLVVGGCYRHPPGERRLPLEIELAARYEKC